MLTRMKVLPSSPFLLCPHCGAAEGAWKRGREFRCPACGFRFFQNVAAACGALVEAGGRYLFLVRAKEPSKGLLGLPGGFVDPGESVETALAREVTEEVGGSLGPIRFLASFPNRYLFAGVEYHTCDLYFAAPLLGAPTDLRADAGEVAGLKWLLPHEVDPDQLACPSLRALWASLHGPGVSR